jgi:predicted deacylase
VKEDSYPVNIAPPDISAYKAGNTGIDYATTLDSGVAGPHAMVTAVVHGNELCGAIALDWLMRENVRPVRGKLTLMFCNVTAFLSFDPENPQASRFVDEDFNRVWDPRTLDGGRDSAELRRARALRPVVDAADFLLDIHSMQNPTAPLMLCGPLEKGRAWARRIGFPQTIVSDAGHAAGLRMRDYGGFGDPDSARNALLVECGQHWERAAAEVARETMLRVLRDLGTLGGADVAVHLPADPPPPARLIEITAAITVATDSFAFAGDFVGMEIVPRRGTVIGHDGETPVTTPYDDCVLIMPSRRLARGQTAVRLGRFVH